MQSFGGKHWDWSTLASTEPHYICVSNCGDEFRSSCDKLSFKCCVCLPSLLHSNKLYQIRVCKQKQYHHVLLFFRHSLHTNDTANISVRFYNVYSRETNNTALYTITLAIYTVHMRFIFFASNLIFIRFCFCFLFSSSSPVSNNMNVNVQQVIHKICILLYQLEVFEFSFLVSKFNNTILHGIVDWLIDVRMQRSPILMRGQIHALLLLVLKFRLKCLSRSSPPI